IGQELVGSRSVASTDQPLIIRYREWGHATCGAMIAFGSRKYYALKLVSSPEGAVVSIDGTDFGTTPNELMIRRNLPELNVIFRKEGFADAAFNLDLDEMEESENLEIEAVLLAEEP
ncbi:MAG: PEGA domain-containing protein, partial [Pseudomonadota bacterium]